MIVTSIATISALATFTQAQELPKPAELRSGEVLRVYERTMSRRGTFENILVVTPTKAFSRNGDARSWAMLTSAQQTQLKEILTKDPIGLRSNKRPNPMWPSAYDASDIWITYRLGRTKKSWGNNEYEYPTSDCPIAKFIQELKTQMSK
ncbi:MAG: hypothetical protein WCI55_01355 [Armatimonadota bacterium]